MPSSALPLLASRESGPKTPRSRSLLALLTILAAACDWGTDPRVATTLEKTAGDEQVERVNTAVRTIPAVRVLDQDGKPMVGATVTFAVTLGGGTIGTLSVATDAAGAANPGSWMLGTASGPNEMTASVDGLPSVTFRATATAGLPTQFRATAGPQEGVFTDARVVTDVAQLPVVRVQDAFGNPVPGVEVSFAVTEGGGSVEPTTVSTGPDGSAMVTRWRLGTVAGPQSMVASVAGLTNVGFSVRATAAAPAAVAVVGGQNQSGAVGSLLPVRPSAAVTDEYGNRVPGASVVFVVTTGGGSVADAVQQTDANGVATAGGWTLGLAVGTNSLEARVEGLTAAVFQASATSAGSGGGGGSGEGDNQTFDITLRFGSGLTPSQQAIFQQAVDRWESVITGDIPSVQLTASANSCGTHPALSETVDDVVIFAAGVSIDGVSGTLGRAGPCRIRNSSMLPALGFMEFDAADLAALESNGLLLPVITHEVGHVLGIGTIWDLKGLLEAKGSAGVRFTGTNALSAFDQIGGISYSGPRVPVENTGGSGTRDAHWRESVMGRELMTGFINNGSNPMSLVTIASLQDLGYQVNYSTAETFSISPAVLAPGTEGPSIQLIELPVPRPILIGPEGRPMPE